MTTRTKTRRIPLCTGSTTLESVVKARRANPWQFARKPRVVMSRRFGPGGIRAGKRAKMNLKRKRGKQ